MLKTTIRNSPALLAFIAAWEIALTRLQRQHVLNVGDSLIVGKIISPAQRGLPNPAVPGFGNPGRAKRKFL